MIEPIIAMAVFVFIPLISLVGYRWYKSPHSKHNQRDTTYDWFLNVKPGKSTEGNQCMFVYISKRESLYSYETEDSFIGGVQIKAEDFEEQFLELKVLAQDRAEFLNS